MTQDEIIEMAIEARLAFDSEEYPEIWQTYMNVGKQEIEAFAKLVAAKERESLAQTQEPVAHCKVRPLRGDESFPKVEIDWVNQPVPGPLYTAPPQRTWVGLTAEQMLECNMDGDWTTDRETAKLNVQAKLKELNT